jgi:hypothetical protein
VSPYNAVTLSTCRSLIGEGAESTFTENGIEAIGGEWQALGITLYACHTIGESGGSNGGGCSTYLFGAEVDGGDTTTKRASDLDGAGTRAGSDVKEMVIGSKLQCGTEVPGEGDATRMESIAEDESDPVLDVERSTARFYG